MLTKTKNPKTEDTRKADAREAEQRLSEIEDRLEQIKVEFRELDEADVEERKTKNVRPGMALCSYVIDLRRDLTLPERDPGEWQRVPPARQRVILRERLKNERSTLEKQREAARSRVTRTRKVAAVKLTKAQTERLQERVDAAVLDLEVNQALDDAGTALLSVPAVRQLRHLLDTAALYGITPNGG